MAVIRGNEIIEDGHLNDAIKQAEKYLESLKKLDAELKELAQTQQNVVAKNQAKSAKEFKTLNAELQKSVQLRKTQEDLAKKVSKSEEALAQAYAVENKAIQRNRILTQDRNKVVKQEIQLNRAAEGSIVQLRLKLSQLTKQYDGLSKSERENEKIGGRLLNQIQKVRNEVGNLEAATGRAQRNVGNYGAAFQKAGSQLRNFAGALGVVTGVQLLTRVIRDAFNVVKDFDKAQANLAAISGLTAQELKPLTDQAKQLGATTAFTAGQVSELQLELAKLGFRPGQIQDMAEPILNLSAALGAELGEASALTGAALKAFGLEASEAGRVTDVLVKAANSAALDFAFFNTALSTVAPVANAVGVDIEQTAALLGTLANSGIDASTSATGLRNIFLELTKSGMTMPEALDMIKNSTDQAATALELFGARGASLGVVLANNQEATADLEKTLNNAGGTAKEVAEKQLDSLDGQLKILRSAWEGYILGAEGSAGASIFLKDAVAFLAENLNVILDTVTKLVAGFAIWKSTNLALRVATSTYNLLLGIQLALSKKITAETVLQTKATKAQVIAQRIAAGATRAWIVVQKILNIVLTANPIGLIIVAIGLFVGAIILAREEIEKLIGTFKKTFDSMEDFNKSFEKFIETFTPLRLEIVKTAEATKKLSKEQQQANKVMQEAVQHGKELLNQHKEEIASMQNLLEALKSETLTREERNEVIDRLNKKYPELLANIDLETAGVRELAELQKILTREILRRSIEEQKAAAKSNLITKAIQLRTDAIITGNKALDKQADDLIKSLELVDKIALKVFEGLDIAVENLDFTGPLDELTDEIERLQDIIAGGKGGKEFLADVQKRLDELLKRQREILGLTGMGVDNLKATTTETGKEIVKLIDKLRKLKDASVEAFDLEKRLPEDKMEDFNAFIRGMEDETTGIEIELRKRGESEEEIRKQLDEKELIDLKRKRDRALELFGENNRMFLEADLELRREIDRRNAEQEKKEEEALKRQREARDKALKDLKKMMNQTLEIFELITEALAKNVDRRIKIKEGEIDASKSRVDLLQEEAAQGNITAQESIKAEEAKQDKLQSEINELERKKQNLLIITTFLQAAQLGLEAGDRNAFASASNALQGGINSLPTFLKGTEDTGDGGDMDGNGGFLAMLHPHERVLTKEENAALGSMSNEDLVNSALRYQNQMALINAAKSSSTTDDAAIISAINRLYGAQIDVKKSVDNIDIPKFILDYSPLERALIQKLEYKNRTETRKTFIRP